VNENDGQVGDADVSTNDLFQADTHPSVQTPVASQEIRDPRRSARSRASTTSCRSENQQETNRLHWEARDALEKLNEDTDKQLTEANQQELEQLAGAKR
jgi:hypothetical protein